MTLVCKGGKLKWREELECYTVYNYDTDDLFRVPETAIDILEMADGEHTVDQIIRSILEKNQLSDQDSYQEVEEFIQILIQKQLLKLEENKVG